MNFLRFIAFALCAFCLISFASYQKAAKSHFYSNEAFMEFDNAQSGAEFAPISSLIASPTKAVHSSTLVQTKRGLMALFFGGSREGASDVKIYQSFYDEKANLWSKPRNILDAPTLSKMSGKFIKKLGNPVAFKDKAGKVHFFVVGVSLGGWATSKIYQLEFDENLRPKFKRELKLGAFANLSHLIRTPAITLDNGGFILPLYHELARKYALVAFFDEKGDLLYTKRLNSLKNQLQPSIIADNVSKVKCLAFLRNHKAYDSTAFLQACSGGDYFTEPIATNLKNYDSSSVLGLIFVDYKDWDFKKSEVVLIHNDGSKENPRSKLSLFWLKDREKGEFVKLFTLDEGEEVSYPALLARSSYDDTLNKSAEASHALAFDRLYISYTLDRQRIKMQILSVGVIQKAIDDKRNEK